MRRSVGTSDLARLAEAIMWDYEIDFLPADMEVVDRKNVLMWRRPHGPAAQRRWANRISYVRTDPDHVEELIEEALAFFGEIPFTWVVGPTTSPSDISDRLVSRGLVDVGDGDLLTAELPLRGLRTAKDLVIREVENEELASIGLRLAHPHAGPDEMSSMLSERMDYLRHPTRRGGYLVAFIGGTPVANAGYRYAADGSTVYLTGAETVEYFRGRGVYQSMVSYRAEAAVARGCRYAAIRSRRDTSLPILVKRGFVNHGHLPIFTRPIR
jgi:hypothetical protein